MSHPSQAVPFGEWCHSCNRHEPPLPDDYRHCGECFHTYRTPREVEEAYAAFGGERSADTIGFCPLCSHTF